MVSIKDKHIEEILERDDKILPHLKTMLSHGAERALMSVLITSPDDFFKIRHSISIDDLTSSVHKKFYEVVCSVSDKRNNGGYVTPSQVLYEDGFVEEFNKFGIPDYVKALEANPYNRDSLNKLIKVLKTKRVQRELWHDTCERLQQMISFEGEDVEDLLSIAETPIQELIASHGSSDEIYKFGDHTEQRLRERENSPTDILGINFSLYPEFTKMINGGCSRELIIGAGRMKSAKSVLLNGLASNVAIWGDEEHYTGKNLVSTGYIDSEMEEDMQEDRTLANMSGVEQKKITNGLFATNEEDRRRVYEAKDWLVNGKLYWKRIREFNTKAVIYTARRMVKEHDIKLLCFDQIKDTTDMAQGKLITTKQRVAWLASSLKFFAEDHNICVIAMMQLNRSGDMDKLRTEWIDPSLAFADADEPLRFANKGFYISDMPRQEIEKRGGVGKVGDKVINFFVNRNGETHDRSGGIGYLFKKRNTRLEEMGNLE